VKVLDEALFLSEKLVHPHRVFEHRMIVVEKDIDGAWIAGKDTLLYLSELWV